MLSVMAAFAESECATEHVSGSQTRKWRLPFRADTDKVKSTLKDGMLTITIPKKATDSSGEKVQKVEIQ